MTIIETIDEFFIAIYQCTDCHGKMIHYDSGPDPGCTVDDPHPDGRSNAPHIKCYEESILISLRDYADKDKKKRRGR